MSSPNSFPVAADCQPQDRQPIDRQSLDCQPIDRQSPESALIASEAKFRRLVEDADDVFWTAELDSTLTYLSPQFERLFGRKVADWVGQSFMPLIHPEDLPGALAFVNLVVETGQNQTKHEFRYPRADGSWGWFTSNVSPVKHETGQVIGVQGILRDISDRKATEMTLHQSQARFQKLAANVPGMLYQFKLMPDGTRSFTYVSDHCQELLGYSTTEIMQDSELIVIHPDDLDSFATALEVSAATLQPWQWTGRYFDRLGKMRWLHGISRPEPQADGSILWDGVLVDISDRKQAEAELQRSQTQLQEAQRLAHMGNWDLNAATGIVTWSEEVFRIFGLPPAATAPDRSQQVSLIHPDDIAEWAETVEQSIASGACFSLDFRIYRTDGVLRYLNALGDVELNQEGQVTRAFGTVMDITERKQAELALRRSEAQQRRQTQELEQTLKELQRTQSQLIQSEKMSSLGQLVAGVAHEINNPVNFIHGNLTPAQDYVQDLLHLIDLYQTHYPQPVPEIQAAIADLDVEFITEDLTKLLSSMRMGTERIRKIVLSLRTFSRLDESDYKTTDIHDGMDSTLMILDHRIKATSTRPAIEIIKDYGKLPLVECYAGQLNQVFMNILVNAIDALEEQEKVSSSINSRSQSSQIKIQTEVQENEWVVIRIKDNGIGMSEAIKQRLFDPFFTTKPVGKGTGMGMSISYQIITEKHNGSLRCLSSPEQGTEFIITIPIRLGER